MSLIEIDVSDEISPMLQSFLESNTRYFRALGKSVGWWFRDTTKREVSLGSAGGEDFVERIPLKIRKKLNPKAPSQWYGRMRQAIGYEYDNGVVKIGWTSPTASRYGNIQEYGTQKYITREMYGFFNKRGVRLSKNKLYLNVPARPIFEPMMNELKPKIAPYINDKVTLYMQGNVEFGKKNRRVYKVY